MVPLARNRLIQTSCFSEDSIQKLRSDEIAEATTGMVPWNSVRFFSRNMPTNIVNNLLTNASVRINLLKNSFETSTVHNTSLLTQVSARQPNKFFAQINFLN